MKGRTTILVLIVGLLGSPMVAADGHQSAIMASVNHVDRRAQDRERDDDRKPDRVLAFFEIAPGMKVLDLFAGGGYYTELVSRVVGADGAVFAHNNQAYLAFAKDEIAARYGDDRLPNVVHHHQEANDLAFEAASFDAALMVLSYHDIYYNPGDGTWPLIDGPAMLKAIFDGLKPGAVLGVVDHVAENGAPAEVGNTLHRIDPERLKREIEAAGFQFDGASDALRNDQDDHAKPMYAEGIRGKTDRVIFRFRRP